MSFEDRESVVATPGLVGCDGAGGGFVAFNLNYFDVNVAA
jgi:hypothetical protein